MSDTYEFPFNDVTRERFRTLDRDARELLNLAVTMREASASDAALVEKAAWYIEGIAFLRSLGHESEAQSRIVRYWIEYMLQLCPILRLQSVSRLASDASGQAARAASADRPNITRMTDLEEAERLAYLLSSFLYRIDPGEAVTHADRKVLVDLAQKAMGHVIDVTRILTELRERFDEVRRA